MANQAAQTQTQSDIGCWLRRLVRRINHRLLLLSGRNAANAPKIAPTKINVAMVSNQLLSRHQGRNDQVRETSVTACQVDAQTHITNTSTAATSPATKPTTKPFVSFGYIVRSIRLTKKAEPPPTRDGNRDSGTDSANGGWLRRLVRPHSVQSKSSHVSMR